MNNFKLKKNVLLKDFTTFKVGGKVKYFSIAKNKDQLVKAVEFAKQKDLPVFVLGGGSNVLVDDGDFNGLVIKYQEKGIKFEKEDKNHILVYAKGGVVWDNLVEKTVGKGLQGIECMSGIPGTVGASPVHNIGAYGQELKDVFVELTAYDLKEEKFVKFDRKNCEFGYRESVFKKQDMQGRFLITEVILRLNKNKEPDVEYSSLTNYLNEKGIKKPTVNRIREAILQLRGRKLDDPKIVANAGSFFKNPIIDEKIFNKLKRQYPGIPYHPFGKGKVKLFSGWLIEKAGWKGKEYKNAAVSDKNALVITNPEGKASARQIRELSKKISKDVFKKFGIKLELEVQLVDFEGV